MKKEKIFIVMMIMISALSLMFSIKTYAQTTNHEPKIVGRWVAANGDTWVFNQDGTGSRGNNNFRYSAISQKLVIHQGTSGTSYDYVFSQDGSTLLITNPGGAGHILQKN